ncbi:MAG: (E)-4-hydroxy-3-methylbut-2-enyl-diphosphate synthase [Spirochaetaceae bacterium]|jgi:(E)-4-hydroxy-3-methylbut-2-enyl-diphosphate synthase|nr:(E)-4-hydroxy-3-methylbut-2-enyl-diphosphate synthase [Spirochaetaceae bacterium]
MPFNNQITIGGFGNVKTVRIGKGLPVAIQTMWKDKISQDTIDSVAARATRLESLGCDILRFAVPDIESAEILGNLAERVTMPVVADIHFDYRIALRCLDFPIAKIRINPGNIGSREKTAAVLEKCAAKNVPVRIGVNSGSLPHDLRVLISDRKISAAEALCHAAERELALFKEANFKNAVVSMKASSVQETIIANKMFSERHDAPLHIGVTEAGPLIAGIVRNTAALYELLRDGIGDTVRISLSDTMENEVIAAKEILLAAGRYSGVRIISCPRCGRCGFDTHKFTQKWQEECYTLKKNVTIAIMGCEVNGLGEARAADLGITGAGNKIVLFKHGAIIKTVTESEADNAFREELEKL